MTPADLLADIEADLVAAQTVIDADRPEGLTFSRVGGCHAQARFVIDGTPRSDAPDRWAAMRGTAIHALLAEYRDNLHEQRVTVQVAGLPVSGAYDELLGGAVVEYKTRSVDECRWHANHGPDPAHAMQAALAAKAKGLSQAFVVYVPIAGTFADWVACPVDVEQAFADAERWVGEVLDGDTTRDRPSSWCERFCDFYTLCRGALVNAVEEPLTDPVYVAAAEQAADARARRLAAERDEKAAWSRLDGVTGFVPALGQRIVRTPVPETDIKGYTRRAHVKSEIKPYAAPAVEGAA